MPAELFLHPLSSTKSSALFCPLHQQYGIDRFTSREYIRDTLRQDFPLPREPPQPGNSSPLTRTRHITNQQTKAQAASTRLIRIRSPILLPRKDADPVNEMVSEWTTYRTRFLIKARQLDAPLSFVDCLGREHSGQKGDYLVLSSDGSQRIAPREIFEDIYVPMREADDWPASAPTTTPRESRLEQSVSPARATEQTAVSSRSVLAQPASARSSLSPQMHSQRALARRSAAQVCIA